LVERSTVSRPGSIEAMELPSSLLVLGGGAVGAELAQAFARFGVEVTVVELLERLVPGDEPEAGELLTDVFGRETAPPWRAPRSWWRPDAGPT
jgi:pyruvate/2-oxoglutarate dehydrogenase complex dihydrolipoamide dehydrogenase (E3) component